MMKPKSFKYFSLVFALTLITFLCTAQEDLTREGEALFGDFTIESSSKFNQRVSDIPSSITVVTSRDIRQYGFQTLAEVINFLSAGFYTLYDRRYEFAGTRGVFAFEDYNSRFLLLVDGHIINEPSNNCAGLDRSLPIPLDLVERVEIIYGPFGTLYGTSNLGGAINVVTKKPEDVSRVSLKVRAGGFNSIEGMSAFSFNSTLAEKPFSGYISFSSYDSDGKRAGTPSVLLRDGDPWYGPVNWDGGSLYGGKWERRADFERSPSIFGKLIFGELSLEAFWGYRKKGAPYAPWGDVYGENSNWTKDEASSYVLSMRHPFNSVVSTFFKLGYDQYYYQENDTYADPSFFPGSPGYFWQDTMRTRRISSEANVLFTLNGASYLAGAYTRREKLFEITQDSPITDDRPSFLERGASLTQRTSSIFATGQWDLGKRCVASLAANYVKYNYMKGDLLYRGSIIFSPTTTTTVKLVAGKGFRAPSYYEYGYSDSISSLSNPSLRYEKSPSFEVTFNYSPSAMTSIDLSLFDQRIDGFIVPVTITDPSQIQGDVIPAGIDPDGFIGFSQFQNQEKVKVRGASLSLKRRFKQGLSAYSNISWQKAGYSDGSDQRLSGSPSLMGNGGLSYESGKYYGGIAVCYLGGLYTSEGHIEVRHKIHGSWDGRLNLGVKDIFKTGLRIELTVVNPFNSGGAAPLSPAFVHDASSRYDRAAYVSLIYGF